MRLKIGILIDSYSQPLWTVRTLKQIAENDCCQLEFTALVTDSRPLSATQIATFPLKSFKSGLWFLTRTLEKLISYKSRKKVDLCSLQNIKDMFSLPEIIIPLNGSLTSSKAVEDSLASAIQKTRDHKPDLLLNFSRKILPQQLLTDGARFGVWSLRHGDQDPTNSIPPGFWEVCKNKDLTCQTLEISTPSKPDPVIAHQVFSTTTAQGYLRNQSNFLSKSPEIIVKRVEQLSILGWDDFLNKTQKYNGSREDISPSQGEPGVLDLINYNCKITSRRIAKKISHKYGGSNWHIIYSTGKDLSTDFSRFKILKPNDDNFDWADPFVIQVGGLYYIYFENIDLRIIRGKLSCVIFDGKSFSEPVDILKTPYHLSYPYIFQDDNRLYMVPESGENKTIDLYECTDFPYGWTKRKTLINNIAAVDSNIIQINGVYYMLTSIKKDNEYDNYDNLHMFYSDSLEGEWNEFDFNPVASNAHFSRNAGGFIRRGDTLLRCSQNCAPHYGYGITLRKIEALSKNEFVESTHSQIVPSWDNKIAGVHTLNHAPGLTVADIILT